MQTTKLGELSAVFTKIYEGKVWGKGSGAGSDPTSCWPYISFLKEYYSASKVLEIGFGDLRMYSISGLFFNEYYGLEVVPDLVLAANRLLLTGKLKSRSAAFYLGTIMDDYLVSLMNKVDIVLIKDVLQHLPISDIKATLKMAKAYSERVLVTSDYNPGLLSCNSDIGPGEHRPLDLTRKPFLIFPVHQFVWPCNSDKRFKHSVLI